MQFNNLKIYNVLSNSGKESFKEKSEFILFKLGKPISMATSIPNKVTIILEGKARLLSKDSTSLKTIAKLGPGSIIGLSSLLRAEPTELIKASEELKTIQLPDSLIINFYKEEQGFRDFCDNSIYPGEVLSLAKYLITKSNRTDINLVKAFNLLNKNSEIVSLENNSNVKFSKDYKQFITSNNIINKSLFQLLENDDHISIRPPFNGRLIKIPVNSYNELFNLTDDLTEKKSLNNLNENNFKYSSGYEETSVEVGQYSPQKKTPIIRAKGEVQEAIASLQMISNEFNVPFRKDSIEKIIRDEIRKGRKPTLDLYAAILSSFGLHVTKANQQSANMYRMPVPTLIPWKNGFAVLKESNNKKISIASPSEGLISVNVDSLENTFGEVIAFLMIEKTTRTPSKTFNINWFIPSLTKYKGVLSQVLLASFVVQLFTLANPLLIQVIIDKVISQRSLDTLQVLGIALFVVTILGGVIGSLRTFLFAETTNRIDTKLGSEVIDHLLRLPLNYFDNRPVGELGTRVAELEKIRNFLTGQALTTILDTAFSVIYIVVMVIYSWLLTFIALGVLPIQIALTLLGSPLLRRQIRETAKENAKTQSHLVEILTGVQTVKAQNVETVSRWKWQELYAKYISRTFEKTITVTALQQTSQVLQQLSQLLVLWVGASLVLNGQLSLGQLIAFRIISGYVTQPLLRLSSIWQSIQELKVSFERLADIIDTPQESNEADQSNILIPTIKGKVKFNDVSFSFADKGKNILKNIDLEINAGQFVGIAGQSGSGKSTLMKLLPRLYEIKSGKISIDDYDVNKVELYSLRKQVGIVPQDPLLFSGSVSENISLTNPEIGSEEIVKAAKIACAHEFIMNLPNGYSTKVGERGSSLSGGQKQRIAIARTLISKPNLVILDEATSALDYDTEKRVCDNLKEDCKGQTVFFITHRLSTIKNADTILLMHEGKIAEKGTHTELENLRGRYYALYRQQEGS